MFRERPGDGFGACLGIAKRAIEICGRIGVGAAAGGDQIAGKFVERFTVRDGLANPIMEDLDSLSVQRFLLIAENIGPLERPIIGKLRPLEQLIDQPGTFVHMGILKEFPRFRRRGQDTDAVQESAAQEDAVRTQWRR